MHLRLGTRASPLALKQTEEVVRRLRISLLESNTLDLVIITTKGDKHLETPLVNIGGKGLFTKELEEALLDGRIDIAVHSMKDVPTILPQGLHIGCILPREDPRDTLFSRQGLRIDTLPTQSCIGTVSLRRQAQILARRPDLRVVPLRGNIETRLAKLDRGLIDATILALAGIRRLGLKRKPDEILDTETMLPAVAQGALGLQIRSEDKHIQDILQTLACIRTTACVQAERAFLEALEGSCRMPIAALATIDTSYVLHLRGLVLSVDGKQYWSIERYGPMEQAYHLGYTAGYSLKNNPHETDSCPHYTPCP